LTGVTNKTGGPGSGLTRARAATNPPYNNSFAMAWILLLIAGLLEVVWAIGLKYTEGFTRPLPTMWTVAAMGGSFYCLSAALKSLPVGTAYAVWTGIGAVGVAILGIVLFNEPRTWPRIVCIALIVAGIAGLKATSGD